MTAEIWDVIIVGAGLSGLSAAHLLRKRNAKMKILILEGKGDDRDISPEGLNCTDILVEDLLIIRIALNRIWCPLQIVWEVARCLLKYLQLVESIAGTLVGSG